MAGSTNDLLTDTFNSANPNVARVTSTRTAGATTLACDNLAGWPTSATSKVHFSTYRIDTNGDVVAGTQIDWTGLVSGNNIGSLVRKAGATDAGNAIGDVVEMLPTGSWAHDLYQWGTTEHNNLGVHALGSNSTITSSKVITSLNDTNGNELIKVTPTASAVNEITLVNAATGNSPTWTASGDDTNVGLNMNMKGTGLLKVNGNPLINRLGLNTKTTSSLLTTTYTTYCTVTATSYGGEVELDFKVNVHDAGSGSARLANVRVQCDGVTVTGSESTNILVALNGGNGWSLNIGHTPSAGSHTWTLQVLATAASATTLEQASLKVSEVV